MTARQKNNKRGVKGFQVLENECIWMKAGIVNFRLCDNVYDCYNCPFDKSMRIAMGKKYSDLPDRERAAWQSSMHGRYDGEALPCRHALTGRIDAPKICTQNYECYHCAYDQWLDEYDAGDLRRCPDYRLASGFRVADGYYYHEGHGWACFEHGGRVRIGFDDFLVKLFGRMQTIELPALGGRLKQGGHGCAFTRNDNRARVLSPVSGSVLAVNHKIMEHPEIAHKDPYLDGWLCIIEPQLPMKDVKKLLHGDDSVVWMEKETRHLLGLMGPEYEELAALGGEPVDDIFGNFPELGWKDLVKTFLKT